RVALPLVAVERERVVAAALLDPERLVEAAAELVRLALEPLSELRLAPRVARELADAALRVVDVALYLARRDRAACGAPVAEALRVAGVLPGLVRQAARGAAFVLHEAVAVPVAVLVDPAQRRERRLLELPGEGGVV